MVVLVFGRSNDIPSNTTVMSQFHIICLRPRSNPLYLHGMHCMNSSIVALNRPTTSNAFVDVVSTRTTPDRGGRRTGCPTHSDGCPTRMMPHCGWWSCPIYYVRPSKITNEAWRPRQAAGPSGQHAMRIIPSPHFFGVFGSPGSPTHKLGALVMPPPT